MAQCLNAVLLSSAPLLSKAPHVSSKSPQSLSYLVAPAADRGLADAPRQRTQRAQRIALSRLLRASWQGHAEHAHSVAEKVLGRGQQHHGCHGLGCHRQQRAAVRGVDEQGSCRLNCITGGDCRVADCGWREEVGKALTLMFLAVQRQRDAMLRCAALWSRHSNQISRLNRPAQQQQTPHQQPWPGEPSPPLEARAAGPGRWQCVLGWRGLSVPANSRQASRAQPQSWGASSPPAQPHCRAS